MGDPTFVLAVPRVVSQDSNIFELSRLGDVESMKEMFANRWASPLVVTEHGETLIQEAIHNGFPDAVRFLIQMGANPEIDNDVGVLPAQEAWDYILRRGHPEKVLEEYKVIFSLDTDDLKDRGFTVVHKYVLGLLETDDFTEAIEKHRAMINVVDRTGRTAAHWAVLRNDLEKLQSLLTMGVDPHIKDGTWGNTLLDYSVRCPSAELTKLILKFGANVNTRTTCKWTPLYGCATYRKSRIAEAHVENARLLVKHGAELDARDEDGVDALIKAARQEVPLLVEYLLDEAGVEINTWDKEGVSALAYAIRRQSCKCLEIILDRGADYLHKDNKQNTILHAVAAEGDLETLRMLQRFWLHGLDPDAKNGKGQTAIEVATKRDDLPRGFLPLFTELCADTREIFRNKVESPQKRATRRVSNTSSTVDSESLLEDLVRYSTEEIESSEDEDEGEFEDAEEFPDGQDEPASLVAS
jgi:ankyrin repeat protein